jgi:hypothetical protein
MGQNHSRPLGQSIVISPQNLQTLEFTKTIKPKGLILYCKMILPQYKLDTNDHWHKQAPSSKFITISKTTNAMGHDWRFPDIQVSIHLCSSLSLSLLSS